ncbi:MAG: DNA polymerase III subunit delta [Arcobacteraceae bacterium]|nr:DNA polymerase III subunit delta [Arcobacteraceae bacterium]
MYKNVFDNHLLNKKVFSAYMFYGQSDFLIEHYASKVALSFTSSDDIQKVYFDDYNYNSCLDTLSQSSLFSSHNILLIKTMKKIPKKEVDKLIEACNINQDSHVIFACMGETDFKTMAKSFTAKTNSAEVRFFAPNIGEAVKILNDVAEKQNISFAQGALVHLYEMHEKDLSLCISDISKLSILQEEITTKTITNQCFGMGAVSVDDFLNNLFLGNHFKKDLYKLLEEGINEIYLVNQMTSFVQQLFTINTYLKLHGTLNIIEIWGYPLPKNIANERANIAVKFSQDQYTFMLEQLLKLELELKSSKITDSNSYIQAYIRRFSASLR